MEKYSHDEMKLAFECGRNFQLTGENNFQELIELLNERVCSCGNTHGVLEIQSNYCWYCLKSINRLPKS